MGKEEAIALRLDRTSFEAGEDVVGSVIALEYVNARSVSVSLGYYDQSDDYLECGCVAGQPITRAGGLSKGEEIPFSFRLPADALPGYRTENGSLTWVAGVLAEVGLGRDLKKSVAIDVAPTRTRASDGAAPIALARQAKSGFYGYALIGLGALLALVGLVGGMAPVLVVAAAFAVVGIALVIRGRLSARATEAWDLSASARATTVPRGEKVTVDIQLGNPAQGRRLEAGLVCTESYDFKSSNQSTNSTQRAEKSTTRFEDWIAIDGASPNSSVELQVPEDVPFSYPGYAFGFTWKLVIRENRTGLDTSAETPLAVLP